MSQFGSAILRSHGRSVATSKRWSISSVPCSPCIIHSRKFSQVERSRPPFRMAVIGSGPAGFYTSFKVMSLIEGAKIDMYESLPVPFGLVRFGVAPDHPEVKVGPS